MPLKLRLPQSGEGISKSASRSGPGRTPALSPPAGQPATSAGEWAGEADGIVPHGTSHVLAGTKFTARGHRSVRRAVGRKRAVGGGATVAVLGRNGGSSAAHCGLVCQAGTAVVRVGGEGGDRKLRGRVCGRLWTRVSALIKPRFELRVFFQFSFECGERPNM